MAVRSKKPSDVIVRIATYFFTALFAVLCVLPMWHVIMASFSDPIQLSLYEGFLFSPLTFSVEGYELLFSYDGLWRSYLNTVIYTAGATGLGLVLDLLAAYVLSRKKVLFQRPLMLFIIITMLFSGGIIPLYIVVRALGLTNTMGSMIIPACCNAMSIIMLKNGMESVNDSICEAAQIDGAGHFRTFLQVMMPQATGVIMALFLVAFIGQWNDYQFPILFLKDYPTLSSGLYIYQIEQVRETNYPVLFAGISIRIIPVIALYIAFQNTLMDMQLSGGLKG